MIKTNQKSHKCAVLQISNVKSPALPFFSMVQAKPFNILLIRLVSKLFVFIDLQNTTICYLYVVILYWYQPTGILNFTVIILPLYCNICYSVESLFEEGSCVYLAGSVSECVDTFGGERFVSKRRTLEKHGKRVNGDHSRGPFTLLPQ